MTGFPLHGLLKHEFEDEIVWIGQVGANIAIYTVLTWPALGPVGASLAIAQGAVPLYISGKSLVGALDHRFLNDQEWEMAKYIFHDSLLDRDQIVLTNLGGKNGAAFVYPSTTGSVFVNLGNSYVHNGTIPDGPLLFHELTHVWQVKARALSEIFLYDARVQLGEDDPYPFVPGQQFRSTTSNNRPASLKRGRSVQLDSHLPGSSTTVHAASCRLGRRCSVTSMATSGAAEETQGRARVPRPGDY